MDRNTMGIIMLGVGAFVFIVGICFLYFDIKNGLNPEMCNIFGATLGLGLLFIGLGVYVLHPEQIKALLSTRIF